MSTHKPKAADDDINDLFKDIGADSTASKAPKTKLPAKGKPDPTADDFDPLAELETQLGEEKAPRPHTPRIRENVQKASPALKRASTNTPPPRVDTARKSAESTGSYHATPSATSSDEVEKKLEQPQATTTTSSSGGGGWWGGLLSTATAAMKTAEAAVKEIQQNEEARKWADQVRGNVGALRGLGDELRHRALPSLTTILHTIAPPISSHERLLIHITHDLVGYPSLDPLIYAVFNRVMAQVEGGDLLVIQRGQESGAASNAQHSTAGWRDGPWWRATDAPGRELGIVDGLVEGSKLCRANAEGYANDYFSSRGGIEAARQRALEPVSESNPVRSSDIFLSVQAVSVMGDKSLFAGTAGEEKAKQDSMAQEEDEDDDQAVFAIYIWDPVHDIRYSAVSQGVPAKWIKWLDVAPSAGESDEDEFEEQFGRVPDDIRDIIESGGVDPREWVAEWLEEALSLSVGIVAQRYVARRMGVGEGAGMMKGKQKLESVMAEGGGEAARAGLI
ncbi:maintenance of telomere capping protein 1 [Triangularia setosa]|uniref:Maintenance of telomere capping protein 1 n=1 Tax=Triangularia setosa TaxID=2587417 RepID=A0AAN6VZL0_9PEZI|nr:maintenance of telomere capping protein 1 [Podospora setosa]